METRGNPEPDATRLARVQLLALDVDGVLTDGRITYGAHGPADERPAFDVHDGISFRWLAGEGVVVAWISGRGSPAVTFRAQELEIPEVHLRVASKRAVLAEVQERLSIPPDRTAGMGDDLPDLGLRARCGFFAAPANARREVRDKADLVTESSGGRGSLREFAELILRAKGRWQAIVDAAQR